jgi:hypothetical protein
MGARIGHPYDGTINDWHTAQSGAHFRVDPCFG